MGSLGRECRLRVDLDRGVSFPESHAGRECPAGTGRNPWVARLRRTWVAPIGRSAALERLRPSALQAACSGMLWGRSFRTAFIRRPHCSLDRASAMLLFEGSGSRLRSPVYVSDGRSHGRVAPGDYSPGAPADPDMPNSGIRLLGLRSHYATVNTLNHARYGERVTLAQPSGCNVGFRSVRYGPR